MPLMRLWMTRRTMALLFRSCYCQLKSTSTAQDSQELKPILPSKLNIHKSDQIYLPFGKTNMESESIKPAQFIGRSRTPEESSEEIKYVEIKSKGVSGHFEKSYEYWK